MAYQVLALKYRPQTFSDVIGQKHVTITLKNAIEADRVAHAILFTGPRGTGKTSVARILAKAMNCENGPASEPCNQCIHCKEITAGNSADVFEIDGASNNNVDQVRELRENVAYLPSSCKYKIYIIDEVHMLSTAAFNALLKTLEEPPEHILFIFATTEPHKIPATILSRCQRHNLGRIPIKEITSNIKNLCEKEGYSIQGKSASLIAAEADGSIRDSLSLTDRILSASPTKDINHESILENLGLIDTSFLFEISKATMSADGSKIIGIIDKVNHFGLDLKKFYSNLIKHFRDLIIVKICGKNSDAINISDYDRDESEKIVQNVSESHLTWLLNSLINEETMIKFSSHTQTAVEISLLKLLQIREGAEIDKIISRLDSLKTNLSPGPADKVMGSDYADSSHTNSVPVKKVEPLKTESIEESIDTYSEPEKNLQTESQKTWEGFLKTLQKQLPIIAVLFKKSTLKTLSDTEIIIELSSYTPFDVTRLDQKQTSINALCKEYFDSEIKLTILKKKTIEEEKTKTKSFSDKKQEAMDQPLVADTMRMFNGTLIDIK